MILAALLALQSVAPSAEQYYARAIEATRGLQQPNLTTYVVHLHISGMGFALSLEPDGAASVSIGWGRAMRSDASFPAAYRRSDDRTSVETPQGWGVVDSPIFDPTWGGVDDWIRYGFSGRPALASPRPLSTPDVSDVPEIAAVRAMGVAFYDVRDGGAAQCADGASAHHVHLVARRDPLDHPLTDAFIDERTGHLCFVRFVMRQSVVAAGYTGTIDLNITDVNGQSLIRSGTYDFVFRAMGFGVKRVTMTFSYDSFTFPETVPGGMFPAT